jgi:hypothetical protein
LDLQSNNMEITPKVIFIITQDGDWKGVYHKGILHDEYHDLFEGTGGLIRFLRLCEIWGVRSFEIACHTLTEEDDDICMDKGSLPKTLEEFKGFEKYNKLNIK